MYRVFKRLRWVLVLVVLGWTFGACTDEEAPQIEDFPSGYFDPHNHLSGVLPWQAYVNLPVFIERLKGRGGGVNYEEKLEFYSWLSRWASENIGEFGSVPFSSSMRFGLGARSTFSVFPAGDSMSEAALNGALSRLYTATPFTEFDSAYALHGPAYTWTATKFYDGDRIKGQDALCTAQMLELGRAGITWSEQSISFIGGWGLDDQGHSFNVQIILCAAQRPNELSDVFETLGVTPPTVRIILMTHTNQLAENEQGDAFKTFDQTGECHWQPLPAAIKLRPEEIYHALLGEDANGVSIIESNQQDPFYNTLVGIDTAAPEMTCFTDAGMLYYQQLVDAVYRASRARRQMGFDGKLLVHTHVGEGFTEYYAQDPPEPPWTFQNVFAHVPGLEGNVATNVQAPEDNIAKLLDAVDAVRQSHKDLDSYVVIRFGHVTHATVPQAKRMATLHIEADVSLDSNISTGSWSLQRLPASIQKEVARAAESPSTNFLLNDLPAFLIPDPSNTERTGAVLGDHPLKYLLMQGVRVTLGTDGSGVEHGTMSREHELAESLITYWKNHDPQFKSRMENVDGQVFFENADWHMKNMRTNYAPSYAPLPSISDARVAITEQPVPSP